MNDPLLNQPLTPGKDRLFLDDVVHAFRWLLGREPESLDVVRGFLERASTRAGLRKSLLLSNEFVNSFEVLAPAAEPRNVEMYLPPESDRFVFIHVPKTGGTTLHALLAAAVGTDRVCRERYNGLWRCTGAELATARLFSGHYDRHCLSFIPGRNVHVVTVLRDPRQRLISLYKYLRSHRESVIETRELELAAAARNLPFGDFLRAALEINPSAVDNTYLRTFGGRLPGRRWEQRAEAGPPRTLADMGGSAETLLGQACAFLKSMSAIGVLEEFEQSLRAVFDVLGLEHPPAYRVLHRLADLIETNEDFEEVGESGRDQWDDELLENLTCFDYHIYELGKSWLAEYPGHTEPRG